MCASFCLFCYYRVSFVTKHFFVVIFIVSWIWNSKNICIAYDVHFLCLSSKLRKIDTTLTNLPSTPCLFFYVRCVFYIFINRLNWKYWRIFDGNIALKWLIRRMNKLKWWRWGINICSISTKVTRFQTCSRVSKWNDRWIIIVKASHKTKLNCEREQHDSKKKTQTPNKITNKILKYVQRAAHKKNK